MNPPFAWGGWWTRPRTRNPKKPQSLSGNAWVFSHFAKRLTTKIAEVKGSNNVGILHETHQRINKDAQSTPSQKCIG